MLVEAAAKFKRPGGMQATKAVASRPLLLIVSLPRAPRSVRCADDLLSVFVRVAALRVARSEQPTVFACCFTVSLPVYLSCLLTQRESGFALFTFASRQLCSALKLHLSRPAASRS